MGEHSKLTNVPESGRLCIRLLLGFIDQVVESGGSCWFMVVAACSFFFTSIPCATKTQRSIADLKVPSFRAVSNSSRILWQITRTYPWIIFSSSPPLR